MSTGYEIIKYRPDLRDQVLELQTHLWSQNLALNSAYLKWKYEENPYLAKSLIYLAAHEGKVVGMRGVYGAEWEFGAQRRSVVGLCAGDLVVAPAHRRQGLVTRIMEAIFEDLARQGHEYIFNLSASPVTFRHSLKMGWRSIGSYRTVRREGRKDEYLRRVRGLISARPVMYSYLTRLQKFISTGLGCTTGKVSDPFSAFDRRVAQKQLVTIGPIIVSASPDLDAMREVIERVGFDGRIRHVRNHRYFAWRFGNPLCRYRFLFWENTRPQGYLVLQAPLYKKRKSLRIVDWEATSAKVRRELLRAAAFWAEGHIIETWSATLPDETKNLLENNGFKTANEVNKLAPLYPSLIIKSLPSTTRRNESNLGGRDLFDIKNWDLRMLYSDGY